MDLQESLLHRKCATDFDPLNMAFVALASTSIPCSLQYSIICFRPGKIFLKSASLQGARIFKSGASAENVSSNLH